MSTNKSTKEKPPKDSLFLSFEKFSNNKKHFVRISEALNKSLRILKSFCKIFVFLPSKTTFIIKSRHHKNQAEVDPGLKIRSMPKELAVDEKTEKAIGNAIADLLNVCGSRDHSTG